MHWMTLHSIGSTSDRLDDRETEVGSSVTLIFALRQRKPWLSCFLQSAINVLITATRHRHSSSIGNIVKMESVSMT